MGKPKRSEKAAPSSPFTRRVQEIKLKANERSPGGSPHAKRNFVLTKGNTARSPVGTGFSTIAERLAHIQNERKKKKTPKTPQRKLEGSVKSTPNEEEHVQPPPQAPNPSDLRLYPVAPSCIFQPAPPATVGTTVPDADCSISALTPPPQSKTISRSNSLFFLLPAPPSLPSAPRESSPSSMPLSSFIISTAELVSSNNTVFTAPLNRIEVRQGESPVCLKNNGWKLPSTEQRGNLCGDLDLLRINGILYTRKFPKEELINSPFNVELELNNLKDSIHAAFPNVSVSEIDNFIRFYHQGLVGIQLLVLNAAVQNYSIEAVKGAEDRLILNLCCNEEGHLCLESKSSSLVCRSHDDPETPKPLSGSITSRFTFELDQPKLLGFETNSELFRKACFADHSLDADLQLLFAPVKREESPAVSTANQITPETPPTPQGLWPYRT